MQTTRNDDGERERERGRVRKSQGVAEQANEAVCSKHERKCDHDDNRINLDW